jgi:hypothetical protein
MRITIDLRGRHLAFAVGLVLLVCGGVAYATIPDSGGMINGCYIKANGALRLIDTEAGQACTRAEIPIAWTKSAPTLTCPEGTTAITGVCIESAVPSGRAGGHKDAVSDCADEGKRLPSIGELTAFARLPGVDLSGGNPFAGEEWTDDFAERFTVGSGGISYAIVADHDAGTTGSTETGILPEVDSLKYRCVTRQVLG